MPDLKSELSKVLQEWDAQDTQPTPEPTPEPTTMTNKPVPRVPRTITSNVTRATFNFVKNNPGIPRVELITKMTASGQLRSSVAAMTSQLLRHGNIEYIGKGLFATQDEYVPLISDAPRPKRVFRVSKTKDTAPKATVQSAGLPDILSVSVHDPLPAPTIKTYATPAEWTVDSVISNLNVRQAMAVYAELRGIFGA